MGLESLCNAMKVKLIGVAFAVNFGHNVFVVVVTQCSAQLVVVHVGFTFPLSPSSGHFVRVRHLKFTIGSFPGDTTGIRTVGQQLQQELPKLYLPTSCIKRKYALALNSSMSRVLNEVQ